MRLAYEAREEEMSPALMRQLERRVVLGVIDRKWREHLYEMDYLQDGIGLRAMAQRNPLVEYQREGFDMFQAMTEGIKEETVRLVFAAQLTITPPTPPAGVEIVGDGAVAVAPGRPAAVPAGGRGRSGPVPAEPDEEPVRRPSRSRRTALPPGTGGEDDPDAFSVPGLDQRVGALSYSAPTLDGDDTGARPARPAAAVRRRASRRRGGRAADGAAPEANRAQRRAAAKGTKRG